MKKTHSASGSSFRLHPWPLPLTLTLSPEYRGEGTKAVARYTGRRVAPIRLRPVGAGVAAGGLRPVRQHLEPAAGGEVGVVAELRAGAAREHQRLGPLEFFGAESARLAEAVEFVEGEVEIRRRRRRVPPVRPHRHHQQEE